MASSKYDHIHNGKRSGNFYGFSRMTALEIRAAKATIGLNDNSRASNRAFHTAMDQFASGMLGRQNPELLARVQGMTVDGQKPSHEEMAIMKVQAAMGFVDTTAVIKGSPEETQRALDSIKQMGEEEFNRFSATAVGQGAYDQLSERAKFAYDHLNAGGVAGDALQKTLQDIKDRRIIDGKFGKVTHAAFEGFMEPGAAGFDAAITQQETAAPASTVTTTEAPKTEAPKTEAPAQPVVAPPAATRGVSAQPSPKTNAAAAPATPEATPINVPLPRPRPAMAAAPTPKQEELNPVERGFDALKGGVTTIFDGVTSIGGKVVGGAVDLGGQAIDGVKKGTGAVVDAVTPRAEEPKPQVAQVVRPVAPVPGAIDGGLYTRDMAFPVRQQMGTFAVDGDRGIEKLLKTPVETADGKHVRITIPVGANPEAYREQLLLSIAGAKNVADKNGKVADVGMKIASFNDPNNISKVEAPNNEYGTNSSSIVVRKDYFDDVNLQQMLRADAREHRGLFSPSINPDNAVAAAPAKPAATAKAAPAAPAAKSSDRVEAKPLPAAPAPQVGAAPAPVGATQVAAAPKGTPINVPLPKARPERPAATAAAPAPAETAATAIPGVEGAKPLDSLMFAPGAIANVASPLSGTLGTDVTPSNQATPLEPVGSPAAAAPAAPAAAPASVQQNPTLTASAQEISGSDLPIGDLAPQQQAQPQSPQPQQPAATAAAPAAPVPPASEGWFSGTASAVYGALNSINPWGETTPKNVTAAEAAKTFDPKSLTQQQVALDSGEAFKAADKQFNYFQSPEGQAAFAASGKTLPPWLTVQDSTGGTTGSMRRTGEQMRKDVSVAKIEGTNMYVVSSATGHTASREALSKFIGEDVPQDGFAKTDKFTVGTNRAPNKLDVATLYSENVDYNTGKLKPGHNPGLSPWYQVGRPPSMDSKTWQGLDSQQQHDQGIRLPTDMPPHEWEKQLELVRIGAVEPGVLDQKIAKFTESVKPATNAWVPVVPQSGPDAGRMALLSVPSDELKAFAAQSGNTHRYNFDFANPAIISEDVYKKLIAKMEDPKNMVAMLPQEDVAKKKQLTGLPSLKGQQAAATTQTPDGKKPEGEEAAKKDVAKAQDRVPTADKPKAENGAKTPEKPTCGTGIAQSKTLTDAEKGKQLGSIMLKKKDVTCAPGA